MDIPECASQQPLTSTSSQISIAHQSPAPDMHIYSADYPHAIDEEFYAQEILQDILDQKHTEPNAEDGDIIMSLLDKEIGFYSRVSSARIDHDAQYFDDDDLYYTAQTDDAYDYPRGVDDDDDNEDEDEDSYTRDPDLRAIFEQGILYDRQKWEPFEFNSFGEELSNAQYFDAVELYEGVDFPASAAYYEDTEMDSDISGESDGDHRPPADTQRQSPQDAWHTDSRHFRGGLFLPGSTSTTTLASEREDGGMVSRQFSRTNVIF